MHPAPTPQEDILWERLLGVELLAEAHSGRQLPNGKVRAPLRTVGWKQYRFADHALPVLAVDSVRVVRRSGPDGEELNQLVIRVVQRRKGYLNPAMQMEADQHGKDGEPDFWFRGGATLIIDLRDGQLRYAIRKSALNDARLDAHRRHAQGDPSLWDEHAFGRPDKRPQGRLEPFAMIHRS
jgi:hypothetical protein